MSAITETQIQQVQQALDAQAPMVYINGEWVPAISGETFKVLNPSTGEHLATVAKGNAEDIDRAVQAARAAFEEGPWASMNFQTRAALLHKLADVIMANQDELAIIESLDGGNPIAQIQHVDIPMSVNNLRSNAGWIGKVAGDVPTTPIDAEFMTYTMRQPVGVVGAITPWNAPFLMVLNKMGTALAAGCTVVVKPAELAPLSALRLAKFIDEVGFPPGVVNIVTGFGADAGQAIVDHPDINKVSFTGSTRVGRSILEGASGNMKRVTLELGGKSPIIVMPDADLDAAAAGIARELCFKTGQFCAAGTRLLVHNDVHDALVDKIVAIFNNIKPAPGTASGSQMGPIISEGQLQRVLSYIADGQQAGATLACGGERIDVPGYFVQPTVLTNVTADMAVHKDEIFGPVLTVLRFDDANDLKAIAATANDTEYGLAAKIWTRNLRAAHGLARRIDAGLITINGGGASDAPRPFGGFKQSGIGREGGLDGLLAYTETKSVQVGF